MLESPVVHQLFAEVIAAVGYSLTVDLEAQTITTPSDQRFYFETDSFRKHCVINGLDEIGLTLQHALKIKQFEQKRHAEQPWLFI